MHITTTDQELNAARTRKASRSAIKQAIEAMLSSGYSNVGDAIADVLVDLESHTPEKVKPAAALVATAKPGRPKKATTAKVQPAKILGLTKLVLDAVSEHPSVSIKELAKIAVGDDKPATVLRVRMVLSAQKKRGVVANVGHGLWALAASQEEQAASN